MSNPRILVVDSDMSYVIPLETKLAEEYGDRINLEIITEHDYFYQLFSKPQTIDLLIVSETYYSADLQRHNIKKILLLTEEIEKDKQVSSNIISLFKYANVREILNIIDSRTTDIFYDARKDNSTQVILITSACGGVGKTAIALGLCGALEADYKKALYIDAEYLQTYAYWFKNISPIINKDVYAEIDSGEKNLYALLKPIIKAETFSYFLPFKASLLSLGMPFSIFERLISDAKAAAEYDYIIVDTDNVFNEEKIRLIGMAEKVFIITTQAERSLFSTEELVKNMSDLDDEKYVFICNMYNQDEKISLLDSEISFSFSINDYVEKYSENTLSLNRLSQLKGVQRMAYLLQ